MIKLPNLQIWKKNKKRFANCGTDHFSFNLNILWINYRSLNDEEFSLLTEQIKLSPSGIRLHFPLRRKHLTRIQYFNIVIKKIKKIWIKFYLNIKPQFTFEIKKSVYFDISYRFFKFLHNRNRIIQELLTLNVYVKPNFNLHLGFCFIFIEKFKLKLKIGHHWCKDG